MDFSTIINHPDSQEIISRLVSGTPAKDIAAWLKFKYSEKNQKHLHLTAKIIQDYCDKHINLMEQLKQDIALAKTNQIDPYLEKKISQSLLKNSTYRERMEELVDTEVDIKKSIFKLIQAIEGRAEQVFDIIQENPKITKNDYTLIKWFEALTNALKTLNEINNNSPEHQQVVQQNITIQVVDQYRSIFQEAVRKTLAKMDPEMSLVFMEALNEELKKLPQPELNGYSASPESRMLEAKVISEMSLPEIRINE